MFAFALDRVTDIHAGLALGVGTFAIGALGLLSKRLRFEGPGRVGVLVLGTVAALSLGVGLQGSRVSTSLTLLGSLFGLLTLVRTPILEMGSRLGVSLLRRPFMPSACLACLGMGLLGWQVYALDRQLDEEMRLTDDVLRSSGPPTLESRENGSEWTDSGGSITIKSPVSDSEGCADREAEYIRSYRLDRQVIQTGQADDSHNCHGWVFTGGKGWVGGDSVPRILVENSYRRITNPEVGDLVVFHEPSGQVSHTGILRAIVAEGILIESKWGRMGRYIHTLEKHAYSSSIPTFYRSSRAGHRLRGREYQADTVVAH